MGYFRLGETVKRAMDKQKVDPVEYQVNADSQSLNKKGKIAVISF